MRRNQGAHVPTLADDVAEAREELAAAEALFNFADQPILIDHAIHRMAAAERRLVFLLLSARSAAATAAAPPRGARGPHAAPAAPAAADAAERCPASPPPAAGVPADATPSREARGACDG